LAYRPQASQKGLFSETLLLLHYIHTGWSGRSWKGEKLSMCTRQKKKEKRKKEKEKKNFLSLLVKSLKENYFNLLNFVST